MAWEREEGGGGCVFSYHTLKGWALGVWVLGFVILL